MTDAVERLSACRQYAQRTPEWYAARGDLITASDAAAALDIKPYETYKGSPRAELLKRKAGTSTANIPSAILMHGVKHEDEARDLYVARTGEEVFEFGLLIHPDLPWLGASPDGVTRSGKLVEIKCPVSRAIEPGKVPEHYVPQIQVCMEVMDLERCVFIQYKPESLTWPKPPVFDVTEVERDREWFAASKDHLHAFWKEMIENRSLPAPARRRPPIQPLPGPRGPKRPPRPA
jgi:putative phage-type endonuclease